MSNKEFENAVDEIVGNIESVQVLNMDLLRSSIKALYEASIHKLDPNEIAQQIMNLPVESVQSREVSFKCEGCTDCKGDHKVLSKDPEVKEGERGDLEDLSYIQNANENDYNKDFYHHCPEMQDDLVRLTHSMSKGGRKCPVCLQEFEPE